MTLLPAPGDTPTTPTPDPTPADPTAVDLPSRLAAVEEYLSNTADATAWAMNGMEQLAARVAALEEAVGKVIDLVTWNHNELQRLSPHVAALAARVEARPSPVTTVDADPALLVPLHQLLDEVRVEHDRVRVRTAFVSSFEERLRRLEAR